MRCPNCDEAELRWRIDGMTAACALCSRIFGSAELLAEAQRRLDEKRARIEAGEPVL